MNMLSLLPSLLKLIGHGQTIKLLLSLILGLMDKHKEGLTPRELAIEVASNLHKGLGNKEAGLGKLLFLSLVVDWAIAEAKSLLPKRPENLKPFPKRLEAIES